MANTGVADAEGGAGEGTSNSGPSSGTPNASPASRTKTTTNTPTAGVRTNKQTTGGILKNTNKPTHEALSKQVDKNFEGATPEVG